MTFSALRQRLSTEARSFYRTGVLLQTCGGQFGLGLASYYKPVVGCFARTCVLIPVCFLHTLVRVCKGTPLRGGGKRKSNKSEDFRVEQVRPRTLRRAPVIKMRFPLHSLPPIPTPIVRFLLCASRRVVQFCPLHLRDLPRRIPPYSHAFVNAELYRRVLYEIFVKSLRNKTA